MEYLSPDRLNLNSIQAAQPFWIRSLTKPPGRSPKTTKVRLVWGKQVWTESGFMNEQDQILPFIVRPAFTASLGCLRVNPDAGCVPISRINLGFSAPIAWNIVRKSVIKDTQGRQWLPKKGEWEEESDKEVQ